MASGVNPKPFGLGFKSPRKQKCGRILYETLIYGELIIFINHEGFVLHKDLKLKS